MQGTMGGFVKCELPLPLKASFVRIYGHHARYLRSWGFMLAIVASDFGQGGLKFTKVVMWVGLNWIPSLIYVSQDILIAF